jgi:hypothetical protein
MWIVYDKTTKRIIRNVEQAPELADNEAALETTPENHRADMAALRPEVVTAGDLATAETVDEARRAAIEFFDWYSPGHHELEEKMLPTPCSPSGEAPATHFLCWFKGTPEFVQACVDFAKAHDKPNVIDFAESPEEFLNRFGLKVIR